MPDNLEDKIRRIVRARMKRGQRVALAKAAGHRDGSWVTNWLSGAQRHATIDELAAMLAELNVDLAHILGSGGDLRSAHPQAIVKGQPVEVDHSTQAHAPVSAPPDFREALAVACLDAARFTRRTTVRGILADLAYAFAQSGGQDAATGDAQPEIPADHRRVRGSRAE